jgi:hypothetical protein
MFTRLKGNVTKEGSRAGAEGFYTGRDTMRVYADSHTGTNLCIRPCTDTAGRTHVRRRSILSPLNTWFILFYNFYPAISYSLFSILFCLLSPSIGVTSCPATYAGHQS